MANKTITQLPLDNTLSGVEEIPLFQSGRTSKTDLQAIAEFVISQITDENENESPFVITQLQSGTTLLGAEETPIYQGNKIVKTTLNKILEFVENNISSSTVVSGGITIAATPPTLEEGQE